MGDFKTPPGTAQLWNNESSLISGYNPPDIPKLTQGLQGRARVPSRPRSREGPDPFGARGGGRALPGSTNAPRCRRPRPGARLSCGVLPVGCYLRAVGSGRRGPDEALRDAAELVVHGGPGRAPAATARPKGPAPPAAGVRATP